MPPDKKRRYNSPEMLSEAEVNMSSVLQPATKKPRRQDYTTDQALPPIPAINDTPHRGPSQSSMSTITTTDASADNTASDQEEVRRAYQEKHDPANIEKIGGYLNLLPSELRNRIYEEAILLADKKVIMGVDTYHLGYMPPILRVCKQIKNEIQPMWFHRIIYTVTIDMSRTARNGRSAGLQRLQDCIDHLTDADWKGILGLRIEITGHRRITLYSITELMSVLLTLHKRGVDMDVPFVTLDHFARYGQDWLANRYTENGKLKLFLRFWSDMFDEETYNDEDPDANEVDPTSYWVDEALSEVWSDVKRREHTGRSEVEGGILWNIGLNPLGGWEPEYDAIWRIADLWKLDTPPRGPPRKWISKTREQLNKIQNAGGLSMKDTHVLERA